MFSPVLKDLSGFAVDLGGTKVAVAAVHNGAVTQVVVGRTKGSAGPQQLVSEMAQILDDIGFVTGQPVGVAVAGRLDSRGQWSAVNPKILQGLSNFPLAQNLGEHLGAGAAALNDTKAAAIGEYRYGAGQGSEAMAYLTVSTGISAGLVLNGVALDSPNGLLGHVGFMTSKQGAQPCGSGRVGTFESIASGRAIALRAAQGGHGTPDAVGVFESAAAGATWAQELIDDSSATIADLCANLAAGLGIECVVLGGGVGLADGYIDRIKSHLSQEPELFQPRIVPAGLGKNSALFGALSVAVERGAI